MNYAALLASVAGYAGIATDDRDVRAGFVFVPGGGARAERDAYVARAVARGAAVVVAEEALRGAAGGATFVAVDDVREATADLAAAHYGHPARTMQMIGITGTCGKTTTTYLLEAILTAGGHRVGALGTVSYRFPGHERPATNTTPGPVALQALLAEMRDAGCTAVVMEVSSHALKQKRVRGVPFDAGVFLNFSSEHLDYHHTLEDYFESKALLFTTCADEARAAGKVLVPVLNAADPAVAELVARLRAAGGAPRVFGDEPATFGPEGVAVTVDGRVYTCGLVGRFNAENVTASVRTACALGVAPDAIQRGLDGLAQVPGRLDRVADARGAHLFVDYAHKPGALENILVTLRELAGEHRLAVVFGCGGDRDQVKRPVMGEIAARLADAVWVTSDNPRTENPDAIVAAILEGMPRTDHVRVDVDRRAAIRDAVAWAGPGDVLVVAGKGPEPYQIVADPAAPGGTRTLPFDDRVEVAAAVMAAPGR